MHAILEELSAALAKEYFIFLQDVIILDAEKSDKMVCRGWGKGSLQFGGDPYEFCSMALRPGYLTSDGFQLWKLDISCRELLRNR